MTKDGTSWATAYTDLQSALAVAADGDTIYVAQGTYKPTAGLDRDVSFQLKPGVTLEGGYPAGGGTRNPAYKTILSGDIGVERDNSDNSYHVVKAVLGGYDDLGNWQMYSATLDGFTITGGNANVNLTGSECYGGGVFIQYGNPTLTNLTFSHNYGSSGGGLAAEGCNAMLTNATFSDNASGNGGGAYFDGGNPVFTNVTFSGNSSDGDGGGIYFKYANSVTMTHVTMVGNSAGGRGGGGFHNEEDVDGGFLVRNSILWGNTPLQITNRTGSIDVFDSVVQGGCPVNVTEITCSGIVDTDPNLGPLGNYGGYTPTIPLLFGSSAIDAGSNYGVTTDQRGVARPQGLGYDIGAYEYVPPDTVPPVVTVPANMTVDATGPTGAIVTFAASAMDDVDGQRPVTCTPSSGSTFPVGLTNVTCTATDASGNVGSASFTVTVRYSSSITIVSLTPTPASLWPPNHKMVNVIVAARTSGGAGVTTCRITGATSSEPDSGLGDGDTAGDIGATTGLAISLRAERSGNGPGRIYTLTVSCSDAAGNSAAKTTTVTVPHDQGKK